MFNEEGTLKIILEKTKIFQENNIELIIVNNGSTDNTKNILEKIIIDYPHARYINLNNMGYGEVCKG